LWADREVEENGKCADFEITTYGVSENGKWAGFEVTRLGGLVATTIGVGCLTRERIDLFSPEKKRIDRPSTGSDHCESCPESCQDKGQPYVSASRDNDPQLTARYHRARHWGPQAHDEEKCGAAIDQ